MTPLSRQDGNVRPPALSRAVCMVVQVVAVGRVRWWSFYRQLGVSAREKAKKQTIRELSRKTLDSIGAKLLIASTALRAYRKRHLGTFMRCCETWKPIY